MFRCLSQIVSVIVMSFASCVAVEPPRGDAVLNVAAVQYPIEGNRSVQQILEKMSGFVEQAAKANANCVIFPELITFDAWQVDSIESHLEPSPAEISEVKRIATEITPAFWQCVAKLARKHHLPLLAGTTPRLI